MIAAQIPTMCNDIVIMFKSQYDTNSLYIKMFKILQCEEMLQISNRTRDRPRKFIAREIPKEYKF